MNELNPGTSHIRMADLITSDRVILGLDTRHKDDAVAKLSRILALKFGMNEELVTRAVQAGEHRTTFGVGRGIAIPHAILMGIAEPIGAFARLKRPADFGASDGRPADLVFLLLVPETDVRILLPALSCVARRLRDREVAARLRAEDSAEAAHLILTTDHWRGHDPCPDRKRAA